MPIPFPFDEERLLSICRAHGVTFVALFGSMARGQARDDSDVDLVVKFSQPVGLYELVGLRDDLTIALGREVDLATLNGTSPFLRDQIIAQMVIPMNDSAVSCDDDDGANPE